MPSASASSGPAASAAPKEAPPAAGAKRYAVLMGKGTFLIDAPLEKIKGMTDEVRGHLDVNPTDLGKSTGEIMVRLSTLKTSTFDSADKNVAQTEHARNWMEVGNESPAASRMKYEWATFTVSSVDATPHALGEAKEEGGVRVVKATVGGTLNLHGIPSKKTVPMTLRFKGPADAPTEVELQTDGAMPVSMKEHDVKPRDTLGGLLNGALDRIGKKIDDKVQVSFQATSKLTMPAEP
jgi:polyisoprenoid-binding protein YceI